MSRFSLRDEKDKGWKWFSFVFISVDGARAREIGIQWKIIKSAAAVGGKSQWWQSISRSALVPPPPPSIYHFYSISLLFRESDPGLIGIDGATETEGKAHFVIPFRGVLGKLKLFGFVPLFLAAKAEEAEEAVNLCLKALRKIPKSVTSTPDSKREKFFRRFNVSATTRRGFSSIAFATNTERSEENIFHLVLSHRVISHHDSTAFN